MADIENTVQNTAGEAGTNTNFDMNSFIENIANAVSKRTSKIENSIVNDNISGLSKEDQEAAIRLWNEHKTKEANKTVNTINALTKERDELKAKVSAYETKERQSIIKTNSLNVLNNMEITNSKDINLIQDLAGDKLYACVKEDGSFDEDKAKTLFEDITKKYELNFETKQNPKIQMGATKQDPKEQGDGLDVYRKILGFSKK